MTAIFAVIKKELASVARDSTIIIAILIQLFIASFSSALLMGMLSLYDADTIMQVGGGSIRVGLVGDPQTPLRGYLSAQKIQSEFFPGLEEAQAAMFQNQVSAIIAVPAAGQGQNIQLYLPNSDTVSSLVRMIIQEPLKQYENHLRRQAGMEVRYTDLKGLPTTSFEFMYSALIPILMFFPAFVAGSMSIDSLTEETENNTLQTLLSTPISINGIISAKIIAAMLLAVMQCAAWLTLLGLNGVEIHNPGWILLLATLIAGLTSTAAATAAAFLRDRERSQFVYSLALMSAVTISTLLDISPIKTISRLAVGDYFTSGWNVLIFGAALILAWLVLLRASRRLVARYLESVEWKR